METHCLSGIHSWWQGKSQKLSICCSQINCGFSLCMTVCFCVFSTKNWWYTWFYRDGRKFVDQVFAKELVHELIQLDDVDTTQVTTTSTATATT